MSYYSLVYLPDEVKNIKQFSFSREQIKDNKLWQVEGTPYYVHTYENPTYSISGKMLRKDTIPFKFLRLNNEQLKKVAEYFLKKGILSLLRFTSEFEDGFEPEGYNELTKLRYKVLNGKVEDQDVVQALKILNSLLEEEYLEIDYIQIMIKKGVRPVEVKFYSTSTITFSNTFNDIEEEDVLKLYSEIVEILTGTCPTITLQNFNQHEELLHPLTNQCKVLEKLFEYAGDKVREEMGIGQQEWLLIKEDLKRSAKLKENKVVYKHQHDRIISDLTNNEK